MKDKEIVYWKQRNGVLISIDDMDINHLRNTLKMLIVNNANYCEHCKYIINNKKGFPHRNMCPNNYVNFDSFQLHGDMAQEFHESYLSDENDDRFDEE